MWVRWVFTVASLMNRTAATSRLEAPPATRLRISPSRALRAALRRSSSRGPGDRLAAVVGLADGLEAGGGGEDAERSVPCDRVVVDDQQGDALVSHCAPAGGGVEAGYSHLSGVGCPQSFAALDGDGLAGAVG